MIIRRLTSVSFLVVLIFMRPAQGGVGGGGSGPPAKEQLAEMLMSKPNHAGIFVLEGGGISLGVNGALDSELVLASENVSDGLRISAQDIESISASATIDAVSLTASAQDRSFRSYRIEEGDRLGEIRLRDRRETMRESIK